MAQVVVMYKNPRDTGRRLDMAALDGFWRLDLFVGA